MAKTSISSKYLLSRCASVAANLLPNGTERYREDPEIPSAAISGYVIR